MADEKKKPDNAVDQLKETMFNRALTAEELNIILDNFDTIYLVYHSITGGLDYYDYSGQKMVFRIFDKGEINKVDTASFKAFMDEFPTHKKNVYEKFETGEFTLVDFKNLHGSIANLSAQVYAEHFQKQRSIEDLSGGLFKGFASEGNKNDLQEAKL